MTFNDFLSQVVSDSIEGKTDLDSPSLPTRAERIRSYMDDSDMTRKEATAMVDFEDGK